MRDKYECEDYSSDNLQIDSLDFGQIPNQLYIMPHTRKKKNTQKFYCPHCFSRLWRTGKPKYHIYYQGKSEIQKGFNLTPKKASLVEKQRQVWVDRSVWIEEFFCSEHGQIWLYITKSEEGLPRARLAKKEDWKNTTRTLDLERPNFGVSEFTLRMSRGSKPNWEKKYYE